MASRSLVSSDTFREWSSSFWSTEACPLTNWFSLIFTLICSKKRWNRTKNPSKNCKHKQTNQYQRCTPPVLHKYEASVASDHVPFPNHHVPKTWLTRVHYAAIHFCMRKFGDSHFKKQIYDLGFRVLVTFSWTSNEASAEESFLVASASSCNEKRSRDDCLPYHSLSLPRKASSKIRYRFSRIAILLLFVKQSVDWSDPENTWIFNFFIDCRTCLYNVMCFWAFLQRL